MNCQRTVREGFVIDGIDLPSGNHSLLEVYPAPPDTGIVFETSRGNQIKATLNNTYSMNFPVNTLILRNKDANEQIAVPEHSLARLYGYKIDNALIKIDKTSSLTSRAFKNFGSARNTQFVPYCGRKLCDKLDKNVVEQSEPRKILTLERKIETDKLSFYPINTKDLTIRAETSYSLSGGEKIDQHEKLTISPQAIKDISTARQYCGVPLWSPKWLTKTVASFAFLSHGFGNGNETSNVFYPARTKESWRAQEIMENEIACHTIMDRLAELALLPGRLQGVYVRCKFAGHKDAIRLLKKHKDKFVN